MSSDNVYNVEKIVDVRVVKGRKQYLIKWEGYPDSENTWQFATDIFCKDMITAFENKRKEKKKKQKTKKEKGKEKEKEKESDEIKEEIKEEEQEEEQEEITITNSWHDQVLKVIQVQKTGDVDGELEVLLEFKNHKIIAAPLKDVHAKCPLKLLNYYEENLSFTDD